MLNEGKWVICERGHIYFQDIRISPVSRQRWSGGSLPSGPPQRTSCEHTSWWTLSRATAKLHSRGDDADAFEHIPHECNKFFQLAERQCNFQQMNETPESMWQCPMAWMVCCESPFFSLRNLEARARHLPKMRKWSHYQHISSRLTQLVSRLLPLFWSNIAIPDPSNRLLYKWSKPLFQKWN